MGRKAWTTFGVGRDLERAWVSALSSRTPPPAAATRVEELEVPPSAAANKFATEVQRVIVDPGALTAVPADLTEAVRSAAALVEREPDLALAVDLRGTPAGQKLLERNGTGDPGERAYLMFGVGVDTGDQPSTNLPGSENQEIPVVRPE